MVYLDRGEGLAIHKQVEARLKELIREDVLKPGERLPSIKELSVMLTATPNAIREAYGNMENEGVIYRSKREGYFVAKKKDTEGSTDFNDSG